MSQLALARRAAVAAFALAALACSSSSNSRPSRPLSPEAMDTAGVGNTDGKSIGDLFAGKFPGIQVARTTDGGLQILVRGGANSFFGSEEPLYVIDETPLAPGSRGIVYLNPNDIERIEILKNPADLALYGIRGGNGVVKITTKRPGRR